jgi:hypothetical protein
MLNGGINQAYRRTDNMTIRKSSREPTAKERGTLTRIYGSEANWLGVATAAPKIRRAINLQKSAKGK